MTPPPPKPPKPRTDAADAANAADAADAINAEDPLSSLRNDGEFIYRHIGPSPHEIKEMLAELGLDSLEALADAVVPDDIRLKQALDLAGPVPEREALARLQAMADRNRPGRSFIGLGYYDTIMPPVIQRNVLENPGWYTAYTPYQAEISQGRLECLLAFQHMVADLTGMELANASLLDEATAAAEAMALAKRVSTRGGKVESARGDKVDKNANIFFVDGECFPQTVDVLKTRAACFGFKLFIGPLATMPESGVFGGILQYPAMHGDVRDLSGPIKAIHDQGGIAVVAADLLSLTLLKPPGEMGADVVIGNSQRFGVPMGYGGPHAAFLATRDEFKRAVPGRIIGVSKDSRGKPALRMALQTREQHIRREKANSNICTAQVLLANIAALYGMYHGPDGLQRIARRVHHLTGALAAGLRRYTEGEDRRFTIANKDGFFDTLTLIPADQEDAAAILERAEEAGFHLRYLQRTHFDRDLSAPRHHPGFIGITLDECSTAEDVARLIWIISGDSGGDSKVDSAGISSAIPQNMQRQTPFLQHPVFNSYRSETEMLRYLKRLENRDISLTHSMIPLGSCTMKLNAASEMMPVSWPAFAAPHPFVPLHSVVGYIQMINELQFMLAVMTGFDTVNMQPNSGAQGEYAGLLTIKRYQLAQGEGQRDVCLIPTSAHGTNPASAQMTGMKVVLVACDSEGNIDIMDLRKKAQENSESLAALMVTYPSTHGVFEEGIREICSIIHDNGGQVYMDGANLNAQVGLCEPADIGVDVAHFNLHKTFCIPHGGGGPGMGPIGVKSHLVPHLPGHIIVEKNDDRGPGHHAVSAAPWGSAGILPISWMYITMMGGEGLLKATQVAILNANYIARKLSGHYPVLYTGRGGMVAHECIIDLRPLKQATGVSDEDVAKRLIDFGFHAPTMSFPVPGTLMIEPTESESKRELDRFIRAMLSIRQEIKAIETGKMPLQDSPLKNAPHTLADVLDQDWQRPYSRREAAFPGGEPESKYWPPVNRVDNAYGDRNLSCVFPSTPPDDEPRRQD